MNSFAFAAVYVLCLIMFLVGVVLLVSSKNADIVRQGQVTRVTRQGNTATVEVRYYDAQTGQHRVVMFVTPTPEKYPQGVYIQWTDKQHAPADTVAITLVFISLFGALSCMVAHIMSGSAPNNNAASTVQAAVPSARVNAATNVNGTAPAVVARNSAGSASANARRL